MYLIIIKDHTFDLSKTLFRGGEDGIVVGTMDGRCIILDLRQGSFAFHTEWFISQDRTTAVTGIEPVPNEPNQILVTSTDSRIRCYSLQDNSVVCRYKGTFFSQKTSNLFLGFTNRNNQGMFIKGVVSPDSLYIASGSEDGNIYSWEKEQLKSSLKNKRDKNDYYQYIKV